MGWVYVHQKDRGRACNRSSESILNPRIHGTRPGQAGTTALPATVRMGICMRACMTAHVRSNIDNILRASCGALRQCRGLCWPHASRKHRSDDTAHRQHTSPSNRVKKLARACSASSSSPGSSVIFCSSSSTDACMELMQRPGWPLRAATDACIELKRRPDRPLSAAAALVQWSAATAAAAAEAGVKRGHGGVCVPAATPAANDLQTGVVRGRSLCGRRAGVSKCRCGSVHCQLWSCFAFTHVQVASERGAEAASFLTI